MFNKNDTKETIVFNKYSFQWTITFKTLNAIFMNTCLSQY